MTTIFKSAIVDLIVIEKFFPLSAAKSSVQGDLIHAITLAYLVLENNLVYHYNFSIRTGLAGDESGERIF